MEYTQVSADAFKQLQLNAGILLTKFTPSKPTVTKTDIIGATSGGVSFTANPEYEDFGEDIDNIPANTYQLKRLKSIDATMSGTFKTVTGDLVKKLAAAADASTTGNLTTITPREALEESDFEDIWWVGDYSDVNTTTASASTAGFIAIHMMNALNSGGFQLQSNDDGKGDFAFEYHAHYDLENTSEIPYEIYVNVGSTTTAAG